MGAYNFRLQKYSAILSLQIKCCYTDVIYKFFWQSRCLTWSHACHTDGPARGWFPWLLLTGLSHNSHEFNASTVAPRKDTLMFLYCWHIVLFKIWGPSLQDEATCSRTITRLCLWWEISNTCLSSNEKQIGFGSRVKDRFRGTRRSCGKTIIRIQWIEKIYFQ